MFTVETLALQPRAQLLHTFADAAEVEALRRMAARALAAAAPHSAQARRKRRAELAGGATSEAERDVLRAVEQRVARLSLQHWLGAEPLEALLFRTGDGDAKHHDALPAGDARLSAERGGQRVGTLLLFLNDVERGGEVRVEHAAFDVQPRAGDAFFLWNVEPSGRADEHAAYEHVPVGPDSEKWVVRQFIRASVFRTE